MQAPTVESPKKTSEVTEVEPQTIPLTAAEPTSTQTNATGPPGVANEHVAVPSMDSKADTTPAVSKSTSLQLQIQALTSLQSRITALRTLPAHLLMLHSQSPLDSFGDISELGIRLGKGSGTVSSEADAITSLLVSDASGTQAMGSQARVAFRMLSEAKEELAKGVTQDALKTARESEAHDRSEISLHGRRVRKKRRVTTADSPALFPSFQMQTTNMFPPLQQKDRKLCSLEDLPSFIREYNKTSAGTKLGIWAQSRPKSAASRRVSDPVTVRVAIHDVAMVFIKLTHRGPEQPVVEGVVALGPREKKSPHSHSDFTVYQKLTQQIARMIEKQPDVSFPQLLDLLASYEDLFVTRCSICERVLSQEGHVPPVARVWIGNSNATRWDARHITCLYA